MLLSLGLRKYPPIDILLGIAAGRGPYSERALVYLLANVNVHYINFDPSAFSGVSFLPATTPTGEKVLAEPGEVSPHVLDLLEHTLTVCRSSRIDLVRS